MSPKEFTAFRLEREQLAALRTIRDRDGIGVSEQVRRALDLWIELKLTQKRDRKRASTRKRLSP
jgi:hypothetical protein